VDLIVVDHLRCIAAQGRTDYELQTARMLGLKQLGRSLQVPIIVAVQVNRAGEESPSLSNLKGSGEIEESASAVVILHDETPENNNSHVIQGVIAKNAHGPKGVVQLTLHGWRYAID
jgi:replicative DNA helicase